jgi:hypothetical protein
MNYSIITIAKVFPRGLIFELTYVPRTKLAAKPSYAENIPEITQNGRLKPASPERSNQIVVEFLTSACN